MTKKVLYHTTFSPFLTLFFIIFINLFTNFQSINQSFNQSINQSIIHSINQSINHQSKKYFHSSFNQSIINQSSINQSINHQSINQSINQSSINQSFYHQSLQTPKTMKNPTTPSIVPLKMDQNHRNTPKNHKIHIFPQTAIRDAYPHTNTHKLTQYSHKYTDRKSTRLNSSHSQISYA